MTNCTSCGRELPTLSGRNVGRSLCADCQRADLPSAEVRQQFQSQYQRQEEHHDPQPQATNARRTLSLTTVLVGINVAVFVIMALTGVSPLTPGTEQLLRWGANWGPLSLGTQPWRMLTSNYVHGGLIHIFFNMWCLLNLGALAERVFDRWTYVLIYTASGLAGSLASLWWHPMVVGVGASGAIFGMAGALIAALYLGKLPIPKEAVKSTMKSLLSFAAYNLLFGLSAGIDNAAHVGGLAGGLALGAFFSRHLMEAPEQRQQWRTYAAIGTLLFMSAGIYYVRHKYVH